MERRNFIKILTSGAIGWAVADVLAARVTRAYANQVPFLTDPNLGSLGGRPDALFSIDPALTASRQAAIYPQSIASGDPNPNGVVLWTRIDPAVIADVPEVVVGWQIASRADFADCVVLEGLGLALPSHDNTVKLPIAHPALRPFTTYHYRFIHHGVASRTGRFKTMPSPEQHLAKLRIGYVVCQDYSNGLYTAYGLLADNEDVDVVVHLGDYIYEYRDDGVGGPNNGPVRVVPPYPSSAQYPQDLQDYRHLYQVYRADPDIQAMHERFAMIQLWDDHEFYNDCHQDFHEDTNTPPLTATTPQPELRQAANQAWTEYGLADVTFSPERDWKDSVKVYRSFRFGDLVEIVVTDERLYRDGPPCGDIETQRYQTTACSERTDPARTMLGAEQKAWFLQTMTTSTATWKLWANEVMLCQYLINAATQEFFDLDQWDGYPIERAQILGSLRDASVQNLVVLSGDAHLYLASYLKTDFNDVSEAPIAVELMVGAISSGNYLDAGIDAPTPLSAPPAVEKAKALGLPMDSLSPLILAQNPHMQFWNGSTWGYAVLTITPEKLKCEFRVASTIKQPGGTLQELATFTVPSGQVLLTPT